MIDKLIPMFVYGTLMQPSTLDRLRVAPIYINEATLEGYEKYGLNIIKKEGAEVHGHYFQVNESELDILDSYEMLDSNWGYHRFLVNVQLGEIRRRAYVYQFKGTDK